MLNTEVRLKVLNPYLLVLQALLWLSMDTAGSMDENNEDFEKMKSFVQNTFYEEEQEITGECSIIWFISLL